MSYVSSLSLSLSKEKNKQLGFTLIELMVVMAIIAILATAGLSAYTGYLKKARDATRIEDIRAINTAIQGSLSVNGIPPVDYNAAVSAANNGQPLVDPLGTKPVCLAGATGDTLGACGYVYRLCDGGAGYLISAKFESKSNQEKYTTTGGAPAGYHAGSCTAGATGAYATTIAADGKTWLASDLPGHYQWMKKTAGWTAGWQGLGSEPDYGDPCPPPSRMPTQGEWAALVSAEGITNIATATSSSLHLSAAGNLGSSNGSLISQGSVGYYWSSSPVGASAYYLYFNSTGVYPAGSNNRAYGFSVRCLQD